MGEAFLKGKKGGGGLKLNDSKQVTKVVTGSKISAGDFVQFVDNDKVTLATGKELFDGVAINDGLVGTSIKIAVPNI